MDTLRSPLPGKACFAQCGGLHESLWGNEQAMSEDFHLEPLPADADTGDLLEALGPIEERPPESQFCVFRSGRERFCLPVLDVEEVLEWRLLTKVPLGPADLAGVFNLR